MTESVVDVSVNAILRAAKDVKMEVLICDPDYVCLLDWRGSALEVRRADNGIWYWAILNRVRGGYEAFQRTDSGWNTKMGARADRLDDLSARDVRGYSTPAIAIRTVAASDQWDRQRATMRVTGRELSPIPKRDERTAKVVYAYRPAA